MCLLCVCVSVVCVSVVCVCMCCVCLCVVLTLWPVRRLVNLADATAQPQLQPSQDAPAWPPASSLLFPPLPSYIPLSLYICPFVAATARRRMEFCNFFGILKLLFLLLQLSRTSRQLFICLPPPFLHLPPGWQHSTLAPFHL